MICWAFIIVLVAFQGLATAEAASHTIRFKAGDYHAVAEIAATAETRAAGLKHRKKLSPNEGMVFVYPMPTRCCMWMRNTTIPLSVAFVDSDGTVVNIADMEPNSVTIHCADRPVKYALEMNKGWFRQRKMGPGTRITGLGRARSAR